MRLGAHASCALAHHREVPSLKMRRAGVRGALDALPSPGHAGYPASMNANASLGYATMAYQCSDAAFGSCNAQRSLLVRLEGQATRDHGGTKKELAQRAGASSLSRPTLFIHVAMRTSFGSGPLDPLKAQGMQLRARPGP